MRELSNSAKRMIKRAQEIKDPALRDKKVRDAVKSSSGPRRKP